MDEKTLQRYIEYRLSEKQQQITCGYTHILMPVYPEIDKPMLYDPKRNSFKKITMAFAFGL